jgi:hypothetical protein
MGKLEIKYWFLFEMCEIESSISNSRPWLVIGDYNLNKFDNLEPVQLLSIFWIVDCCSGTNCLHRGLWQVDRSLHFEYFTVATMILLTTTPCPLSHRWILFCLQLRNLLSCSFYLWTLTISQRNKKNGGCPMWIMTPFFYNRFLMRSELLFLDFYLFYFFWFTLIILCLCHFF